jgi:hypothetical protein
MSAQIIRLPISPTSLIEKTELAMSSASVRLQRSLAIWYDLQAEDRANGPERLMVYPDLVNDSSTVLMFGRRGLMTPLYQGRDIDGHQVAAATDAVVNGVPHRPIAYWCRFDCKPAFSFILLPFERRISLFVAVFDMQ